MLRWVALSPVLLSSVLWAADPPVGSSERVPWTTSRVTGSPVPPRPYRLELAFPALRFDLPVALVSAPGSDRLFLAELKGKIYSFANRREIAEADLFFDAPAHIAGVTRLFDLTFHPQFATNRYVYVCYVTHKEAPDATFVSRFTVTDSDPPRIDPASELVLIRWKSGGHNGGCLRFGPDGYLYISTGDGSVPNPPDQHDTGQDVSDLLASILRIDVDHADGSQTYRVPADNPFVGREDARPEVWSYGFRNPWKMSFDAAGNLWVGDVGWELWEMVYRVERGGNYGWSVVEGPQSVRPEARRGPTPILPPTVVHSHVESRSLTGGLVYRGERLPKIQGHYVYGDYVTGKLWSFRWQDGEAVDRRDLADSSQAIITFGEDNAGELYVVGYDGTIHRLVPNEAAKVNTKFPTKLSETGLFTSVRERSVAPGVLPYSIIAEPWMDGAKAERHLAMPGAPKVDVYQTTNLQVGYIRGQWDFPADTVFMKTLSLPTAENRWQPVETQLLHRDGETWRGYTFAWNDAGTDAELVPAEGLEKTYTIHDRDQPEGTRKQRWRFVARAECIVCHTTRGGSVYGFRPEQLDKPHDSGGSRKLSQLDALTNAGVFDDPAKVQAELNIPPQRRFVDPHDESADLDERARDYLHVNCSHCHLRGGGGTAPFVLPREIPLEKTDAVGTRPTQGTFAIYDPQVIAPGDPYRSLLFYRMATLGSGRMPHFGSRVVDVDGLRLIHDWIAAMPGNSPPNPTVQDQRAEQRRLLAALKSGIEKSGASGAAELNALLSSTSGALVLLEAFNAGKLPASLGQAVARRAREHTPPHVAGLFERFLPEAERLQRLGETVDAVALLRMPGDANRGRKLFTSAEGVQCRNCHQIGQSGRELGPRLDDVGRRLSRAEILTSILDPSEKIESKYLTWLVETSAGQVHSGLLVSRDETAVTLRTVDDKTVRVPTDEVEQLVPARKSVMPELLLRDLTAEQVADLLAFLASLQGE